MITPASFRQQFNEFADPAIYTDEGIVAWTTVGSLLIDAGRWGDLADYGVSLYIAHRLVLSGRDARTGAAHGTPGLPSGILSSKSVDKVSASYDINSISVASAGQWNMTRYGIELYQLMSQFGAGGVQIPGSGLPLNTGGLLYGGYGWFGSG